MEEVFIKWFEELTIDDIPLVGGKNASLGEMIRNIGDKGVNVPSGFAITSFAYKYTIEKEGVHHKIKEILSDLNTHDINNLSERGGKIRDLIKQTPIPLDLEKEIRKFYKEMEQRYGDNVDVAVRSSATAEDLPDASFAGQQETYLNIRGEEELLEKVKDCFASLFTNRAISYRTDKGFDHFSVYLSVGVQKMVRSDLASSGVMFSIDTESGFENAVYITGAYGLGENVVQGTVNPDQFYVFKPTLIKGFKPILEKKLGSKEKRMIYGEHGTGQQDVSDADKKRFVISDEEILNLANWAIIIENHYKKPMDIEWAKDGQTEELFIVQARPETVHSQKNVAILKTYILEEIGNILVEGEAVGSKIGQGTVNVIENAKDINQFHQGQVLVTDMTDPDWEPIMKIASAIVTNRGGRTCHAAIISRELGIPCVIGTGEGTSKISNASNVTVDCSEGIGKIYEGLLKYKIDELKLDSLPDTKTKIMMNVGTPEKAFTQGQIPNDGIGLAREEFIINSHIGIHPLALIEYEKLKQMSSENLKLNEVIKKIDERSIGYQDKVEFFVDTLARGIAKIAAGFYPNDVIVRMSDFKTNEYANLIGGTQYEPIEANPMMGWRGASRYYSEAFLPAFEMECAALKKVRDDMGLKNLKVMIPICRTVEEGKKVLEIMEKNGLKRGENGLEIYVMAEVPSNIILAEKFAEIFDGFSIGSNDLTQFTLAIDRDSAGNFDVEGLANENNEAVKILLRDLIKKAKKAKTKVGICGQAPSDYPEMVEFLVECGIDSISLTPDTVIKSTQVVYKTEQKIKPACRQAGKK